MALSCGVLARHSWRRGHHDGGMYRSSGLYTGHASVQRKGSDCTSLLTAGASILAGFCATSSLQLVAAQHGGAPALAQALDIAVQVHCALNTRHHRCCQPAYTARLPYSGRWHLVFAGPRSVTAIRQVPGRGCIAMTRAAI
jgi:hypothetical protein